MGGDSKEGKEANEKKKKIEKKEKKEVEKEKKGAKEVAENPTVCAQAALLAPPQLELASQFLCYMMMMVMMTLMMMIKRLNAQIVSHHPWHVSWVRWNTVIVH